MTSELREQFERGLRAISDIEVGLWKESDLMCVYYKEKEFAHFHGDHDIDVRLSQRFIKKENLVPMAALNTRHPERSKKSRWMEFHFEDSGEVEELLALINRLIEEEYKDTGWGRA